MWGSGGDERGPQAANIESGGGGLWEGVPKRLKLSIVEGGCILEGLVINLGGGIQRDLGGRRTLAFIFASCTV